MCFNFCIIIYSSNCPFTDIIDNAIIRSSCPEVFCKKSILTNFAKFTRKHLVVFCEFCKISHNAFFIESFGRLLLHNHLFCLLFNHHHDLSPFQKRCQTYFPAEYFLGLICRLGTRVSSTFQLLIFHHKSKIRN